MREGGAAAGRAPERREPPGALEDHIQSQDIALLRGVASSPRLTEELALALLNRRELPPHVLQDLARNGSVMRHRKVIVGIAAHQRTPRHVALPIVKSLYTFELMQLALTPGVAADLKLAMEETLAARMETISSGERLTLAKRGSTRIAAALLGDAEARVVEAALDNPYLNEAAVVKAVMREHCAASLVQAVLRHGKWPLRRDVQVALLRNQHTPLAKAIAIADALPAAVLEDVLRYSRLQPNIRRYLEGRIERRKMRTPQ